MYTHITIHIHLHIEQAISKCKQTTYIALFNPNQMRIHQHTQELLLEFIHRAGLHLSGALGR